MRSLLVRPVGIVGCVGFLLLVSPAAAPGQISLTGPGVTHTENFNSLANAGATGSALPTGWSFVEVGSGADTTYGIGDGSSNATNTYSFGSTGSADRAIGAIGETGGNGVATTIGALFQNNTGLPLAGVTITFTGEQWRRGNGSTPDRLDFASSTDATGLSTGTWTDVNALDFTSPVTGNPPNRALDGNATANRTMVTGAVTFAAPVATGGTFFIRWTDFNSTAQEDGMAIDDFNITPVPEPTTVLGAAAAGLGLVGWVRGRRRSASRRG
jgi:hypothetical protein